MVSKFGRGKSKGCNFCEYKSGEGQFKFSNSVGDQFSGLCSVSILSK